MTAKGDVAQARRQAAAVGKALRGAKRTPLTTANNASGAVQGFIAREGDRALAGKSKSRAKTIGGHHVVPEWCNTSEPRMMSAKHIGRGTDGKWYGWSHRAIKGFASRSAASRFAHSVS